MLCSILLSCRLLARTERFKYHFSRCCIWVSNLVPLPHRLRVYENKGLRLLGREPGKTSISHGDWMHRAISLWERSCFQRFGDSHCLHHYRGNTVREDGGVNPVSAIDGESLRVIDVAWVPQPPQRSEETACSCVVRVCTHLSSGVERRV
jgi:hypothetical protein